MGNYKNIEVDFIERTLAIISQYETLVYSKPFEQQYNYTLLLNCLLGLVVMPKEISLTYLPKERLTKELLGDMGLNESIINSEIKSLNQLIVILRHSIAHFDFEIRSSNDEFLIDEIVFNDSYNGRPEIVIFKASELLPFIRYYANWTVTNLSNKP